MLKRPAEIRWNHRSPPQPWPQCPGANTAFLGPSGTGKTTTIVAMIVQIYRGIFAQIHVFSPSIHIDSAWGPVKELAKNLEGSSFHDHWDEEALHSILHNQREKIMKLKETKTKKPLDQVLIILDDMADDSRLHQSTNSALAALFARGRHLSCSCFVSTQKFTTLAPIVRANLRYLLVWRLRSWREIESLMEELSALYPKHVLYEMYRQAIDDAEHSFWFISLVAKRKEDMFYVRFEHKMVYD